MSDYKLKIEFLSETILGSGESVPGSVDLEVLHDEYGLPYFKGKTLKGRLREEAENIKRLGNNYFNEDDINSIFGYEDKNNLNKITFADCHVSYNIRAAISEEISKRKFKSEDVFYALTDERSFTSIGKNGVAEDGSLRSIRTINKGLILFSEINAVEELNEKEEMLLSLASASLKHIGLMCSRGKGNVRCTLYKDEKEISREYIKKFSEGR